MVKKAAAAKNSKSNSNSRTSRLWETGTRVTLTTTTTATVQPPSSSRSSSSSSSSRSTPRHVLELLVDASFATHNGGSTQHRPLLLSLPSRPFARLRPAVRRRQQQQQQHQQQQQQKQQQKQQQQQQQQKQPSPAPNHEEAGTGQQQQQQQQPTVVVQYYPIALDGRVVGTEALWRTQAIRPTQPDCATAATATATAPAAAGVEIVALESIAHPGLYLAINDEGRVTCCQLLSPSPGSFSASSSSSTRQHHLQDALPHHCVFQAILAEPRPRPSDDDNAAVRGIKLVEPHRSNSNPPPCLRTRGTTADHDTTTTTTTTTSNTTVRCDASRSMDDSRTRNNAPWPNHNPPPQNPSLLSKDQIMQFAHDGYLVLRDVVPANVWQPAAASVFGALGQPGAVIHGGDGSNSGHPAAGKLSGKYTQTSQMRALLGTDATLARCAAQLMQASTPTTTTTSSSSKGVDDHTILADHIAISHTSAQVALRFPEPSLLGLRGVAVPDEEGLWAHVPASCTIRRRRRQEDEATSTPNTNSAPRQDGGEEERECCARERQATYLRALGVRWHIDGTRQRQYHGFTLLMGVALSDCGDVVRSVEETNEQQSTPKKKKKKKKKKKDDVVVPSELEGQLCVWPRSHWHLQGMGQMCEPQPVDYAAMVKAGAPLDDYEYFDYLDSADATSRARSMKYLDAAAAIDAASVSKVVRGEGCNDDNDHANIDRTNLDGTNTTPSGTSICRSSPGGVGPVVVAMKAGDGVLLHSETAHAATPNFNPSKVRAMAYFRLRLLPSSSPDDKRNFRGEADRKELRDVYEWGMEIDRTLNAATAAADNTTSKETDSSHMLTPGSIAAAKRMLASLWPDLDGVSEVLSEYVDAVVDQHQVHTNTPELESESEGCRDSTSHEEHKVAGLKLLKICNLHPRSPMTICC